MKAIFKKELKGYFSTPLGFVFIAAFVAVSALFFALYNLLQGIGDPTYVFSNITLLLILLIPILTMRSFAEEKSKKTDRLLLTAPVRVYEIVLGKLFAACFVLLVTLIIMLIYPLILSFYTDINWGEIFGTYLGFFLMGATFISIGIFLSNLTESLIISAISTFVVLFVLYLMDWITYVTSSEIISKVFAFLSVTARYTDLSMGIINIPSVIYYISAIAVFTILTVYHTEKRKFIK